MIALSLSWAGAVSGAEPAADPAAMSLGVAPFEVEAPPGTNVPDVATLLADRLGTRGVQRVVGPGELGAAADAEPEGSQVQAWALRAELDAIVVGRTTRIGNRLSVDVRLREGRGGTVSSTFVQQVPAPDQLEEAVDALALRVIDGTAALPRGPVAQPEAAAATEPAQVASARPAAGGNAPFGFEKWRSDDPFSISSDSLEAEQKNGRREIRFEHNVRVEQGELRMTADRLEAFYPPSGSEPERLVATGRVHFRRGDQAARCDRAVYDRLNETLSCSGNAHFEEKGNRLSGKVIDIDLAGETVKVRGGASIFIEPEKLKEMRREGKES